MPTTQARRQKNKLKKFGYKKPGTSSSSGPTKRKTNSKCVDCKGSGHWKGDPECPKMKNGTTPQWRPNAKKKKAPFAGGTACGKRASGNTQRAQQTQSRAREMHQVHRTTARPASFPEYASSSSDEDFDSEHDEETSRRQAFRAGPTVTVHTPQGPQQLATMDYTQFKVVTLYAFLKNKGLSQAGRKADLIARLKHH